jgi:integrase
MLEAAEVRGLLDTADTTMKALILLGVNAGLGNTDVADMQRRHLDLDAGWLTYPRPKTGISRRCKLWPETVEAIRAAVAARPEPKRTEDAGCVFLSEHGWRLVSVREVAAKAEGEDGEGQRKVTKTDAVTRSFAALLARVGIKREGISFYVLRHVFETIAGGCRDQVAVDSCMGHADGSMAASYRERIDDARLAAVANHVHGWLWPEQATAPVEAPAPEQKPKRKAKTSPTAGTGNKASSRPTLRLFQPEGGAA